MSRTIETIIRMKGESEYRTALKNCGTEMKVLKSELSLTSSQFRTNANSMEALTAKGDVLTKMYANQEQKVALLRGALEKARQTQEEEQKQVAELQEKYQAAKKQLDAFGDSVDQTSEEYKKAKAETENLQNALTKHQLKLESATGAISKYSIQLNRAEVDLNALSDQQEKNNRLIDEAKSSADGCAKSIDQYGDAVREAAEDTANAGSAVEALAGQLVASGIKEKVDDVAAAMLDASKAAQTYELSIAQVSTIADESVLSKSAASAEILKLSTDLRKDADEVAEAAYEALSAGVDTANVLNFTAQASQLATAGFTDTATSVDVLTTIMNAYKMESSQTEKVASTLVKTQDLGKITVDQLARQIGRVIPSAAAYGVNLDNIATAYAHMTASGINAENSTTYLTKMLDELSDSGSAVAGILEDETGQSFAQLMASGKSLGDVLDILGQSVDGDKVKFSNLWGSATAGKAAISLLNTGSKEFNSTLNQMENSSGTVAANYKKMTDVSDFASQRLAVANKNLSIVVGNQLNPVLDKLRNAGAGILEMAAEVIADNPVLVSVISGLVTSLGLLATGLSALMIVKSVTAAMQALNITMLANPAVLIATAVAGLVAALAVFCTQAADASSQVDALTESAQKLNERTTEGAAAYRESASEIEATYQLCAGYIERLSKLEQQASLTKNEQIEYNALLEQLLTYMPDLNVELDEETGLIKGGAAALLDKAKGWKEAALAEAMYAKYKDDIAAMADAEYELAKNQAKLAIVSSDLTTKKKQLTIAQDANTRAWEENQKAVYDTTLTVDEATEMLRRSQEVLDASGPLITTLTDDIEALEKEADDLTLAVSQGEAAVESNTGAVELARAAMADLAAEYPELAGAVSDGTEQMADSTSENLGEMSDAYLQLYDDAKKSLDGQFGLFEKVELKCELSTKDMVKNLLTQKKAFENYADNLTLAMERGVDMGLVQKLSDGSAESMAILDELVNASDADISRINDAFGGMSVAKDHAANAMAGVKEAVEDGMDDAVESVNDKADDFRDAMVAAMKTAVAEAHSAAYSSGVEAGKGAVAGIIVGVNSMLPKAKEAMETTAEEEQGAYKAANDQHSPSRKFRKFAANNVEGIIVQYKADTPKLNRATVDMANAGYVAAIKARRAATTADMKNAGYVAAIKSRRAAIPSISSAMPAAGSRVGDQSTQLLQQILTETKKGRIIVLDSGEVVGATVNQYDAALGQNQILSDRGAQ